MKPLDPRLLRGGGAVRPLVAVAAARSIVDAAAMVAEAAVLAFSFAAVVDGRATAGSLVRAGLLLVVCASIQAAAGWVAALVARRAAARTVSDMRQQFLGRVLEDGRLLPPGEVSLLATRGVDAVEPYIAGYVPQLVNAAVVPIALLVTVFAIDRTSGLILLVVLPLVPLFLALVGRFTEDRAAASWQSLEELSRHLHDVVTGLPTLKRFGRHRAQGRTIRISSERARRSTMAGLRSAFLSALVLELAATLSVALVAVPLGLRLVNGSVGLAAAFVVLVLAPEVFAPIRKVGSEYHTAAEGVAATNRILDIVHAPRAHRGTEPVPLGGRIVVQDITVRRPGRATSSPRGVTVDVGPGEVVALVGPNGSGKSTLFEVLRGAIVADAGSVAVDGVPLEGIEPGRWAEAVAWVPQRPVLTDESVRANLLVGAPRASAATVSAVATSLGLDAVLGRRARTLSAGERQRVALGRAMVRVVAGGARLALLDEPTANLDPASEDVVVDVVRQLASHGAAVLVVAHRPAVVAAADRVVTVTASGEANVASVGPSCPPATDRVARGGESVVVPASAGLVPGSSVVAAPAPDRSPRKWLHDEARPVRARLLATVGAGSVATGCGLALVASAAWLLARASQQPDVLSLAVVVVLVRAFALAKAGMRYVERLVAHDTILRLMSGLRVRVFDRLAVLTPGGLTVGRHGEVLARLLGDLDAVQDLWLRALIPPAVAIVVGTGLVLAGGIALPMVGLVLAGGLLVGGVLIPALGARWRRGAATTAAAARVTLTGDVVDLAECAPELHAYGATPSVLTRVAARDRLIARLARRETRVGGLVDAGETVWRAVVAGGVLVVAGTAAAGDRLGVLAVPAFVLLAWLLPEVVGGLPNAASRLAELAPAAARITDVLAAPDPNPDPEKPLPPPTGALDVALEGVSLRWPGRSAPVLCHADLWVRSGETVFVVGSSGAGKSTMAAGLVRFLVPEAGQIRLGGIDVQQLRGDDVRRLVGWCAQDGHLFDASIRDNLRIGRPDATDADLWAVLRSVRLAEWIQGLPFGLDTMVGIAGAELSGGQAQRIAVAQVLLTDPAVVVLDEPTANLDPQTAEALMSDLVGAAWGRTTIVITHRVEGIGADDRVVRLAGGRFHEERAGRSPAGERVAGEAAHGMHLVGEHTGSHPWLGVEDADAAPGAVVDDRAHDVEHTVGAP